MPFSERGVVATAATLWRTFADRFIEQEYTYNAPATGFSLTIGNSVGCLILNPAATLATGTVTMPASPWDGQRVEVCSTQTVTTLTVSANTGQSIKNAPTMISAGSGFRYRYRASDTTWYRLY